MFTSHLQVFRNAAGAAPMSIQAMEDLGWSSLNAVVVRGRISVAAVVVLPPPDRPVICLPDRINSSLEAFMLAHELGHLMLGHHPAKQPWLVREAQANHFAKRATQNSIDPMTYRSWVATTFPNGLHSQPVSTV